ncbi:MAG: adenosine deaminase [Acidimicrobiia bacterium]
METFIRAMPKAELHLHIEGTLEPEMMLDLAQRNGVTLAFESVDEIRRAYEFKDLQSFLDVYYQGADVLRTEQDFYDLMWAYLRQAHGEQVRHAEIFFDPQTHTGRGVPFGTFMKGFHRAMTDASARLGISSLLIMCFLRHLSDDEALETLEQALPYKRWITAVGLDSSELGNPPEKFAAVFERARTEGLRAVAHAGEEGPPEYITGALDVLGAERIDHGVHCEEDEELVQRLIEERTPLTMCPLSNVRLQVFTDLEDHNLKRLLDQGIQVSVNSDDPAYFGGYVTDNFLAVQKGLDLSRDDLYQLARNSFEASFLPEEQKRTLIAELNGFVRSWGTDEAPPAH